MESPNYYLKFWRCVCALKTWFTLFNGHGLVRLRQQKHFVWFLGKRGFWKKVVGLTLHALLSDLHGYQTPVP